MDHGIADFFITLDSGFADGRAVAIAIASSYVAPPSRGPLHCKLLLAVGRRAVVLRATLSAAAITIAA